MISSEFFEMLVVFSAIVLIVKTIADYKTKSNLIKHGLVDEKIKYLFTKPQSANSLSSVKWGLVLIGIGSALFLREWVDFSDEAIFGLMFLSAGFAFLIYYGLSLNNANKDKEDKLQ